MPLKYVITYHNVVGLNLQVVYLFYNPSTFIRKEGYIEDSSQYAGFIRIEQSAKCVVSIYVDVVVEQRKLETWEWCCYYNIRLYFKGSRKRVMKTERSMKE